MNDRSDIKKALLRQAVRENEDVIKGRYRFRRRTPSQQVQRLARALFLMAVPLALFSSAYLVSTAAGGWFETQRTAETARFEEARAASEKARADAETAKAAAQVAASRLEARRSLDSAVEAQGEEAVPLPHPQLTRIYLPFSMLTATDSSRPSTLCWSSSR